MTSITAARLTPTGRTPRKSSASLTIDDGGGDGWVYVHLGLETVRVERGRWDEFISEALPAAAPPASGDGGSPDGAVPCETCEGTTYRLVIDGRTLGAECLSCHTWLPLLSTTLPGRPGRDRGRAGDPEMG